MRDRALKKRLFISGGRRRAAEEMGLQGSERTVKTPGNPLVWMCSRTLRTDDAQSDPGLREIVSRWAAISDAAKDVVLEALRRPQAHAVDVNGEAGER
jgi:hypothetical protein